MGGQWSSVSIETCLRMGRAALKAGGIDTLVRIEPRSDHGEPDEYVLCGDPDPSKWLQAFATLDIHTETRESVVPTAVRRWLGNLKIRGLEMTAMDVALAFTRTYCFWCHHYYRREWSRDGGRTWMPDSYHARVMRLPGDALFDWATAGFGNAAVPVHALMDLSCPKCTPSVSRFDRLLTRHWRTEGSGAGLHTATRDGNGHTAAQAVDALVETGSAARQATYQELSRVLAGHERRMNPAVILAAQLDGLLPTGVIGLTSQYVDDSAGDHVYTVTRTPVPTRYPALRLFGSTPIRLPRTA